MKAIEDEFRQVQEEFKHGMRGHLRIESMAKLLSEPEPPLSWLIENIWTDKSRGLIAGHPGVGKTWIALDMLISVASGQLCLGKYPVKRAATLLVEEEASRHNLQRRVHSLARARGLKDTDLTNLFHITAQFAKVPRDTKEIAEIIKANGIKLVVFDSLRRFHSAKENSSDEMQPVLDAFAKIGVVGDCSVILIHHLSKSGNEKGDKKPIFERMRGTGDLWAWRDCVIGVEGEEDADIATCSFQFRDAESTLPFRVKRTVNDLSGSISLSSLGMEESEDFLEKSELIMSYMKTQYGPVSQRQACDNVKGRRQELNRVFKLMIAKKMVVPEDGKWVVPK